MADKTSDFLLKNLNEAQCEAVSAPLQNMLIVAGAGTGKTRVLVSRISWLLKVEKIPSRSIMAVTFTNKAAKEMKERVEKLAGEHGARVLVSTFHSFGVRMLRTYSEKAGLMPNFNIYDAGDQRTVVSKIMKSMKMEAKEASKLTSFCFANFHNAKSEGFLF